MFHQYLYYSSADANRLRDLLTEKSDDTFMNHYARTAIFGHERVVPMLSFHFEPIRLEEIEEAVRAYQAYVESFAHEKVLLYPLSYVITKGEADLCTLTAGTSAIPGKGSEITASIA